MKMLAILLFIIGLCAALYIFIIHLKKINWKLVGILGIFGAILMTLFAILVYQASKTPDSWCDHFRTATTYPPAQISTAMDFFEKANFEYDTGNCKEALTDYAKSISLDPNYPESYNNKAYTEMRMRNYKDALNDLNQALTLNPNYINALMNRGDIRNYYFEIDKNAAVADYKKIISLVGTQGTGVCGHLFMATHDRNNIFTYFQMLFVVLNCRGGSL